MKPVGQSRTQNVPLVNYEHGDHLVKEKHTLYIKCLTEEM